jgi:hypothetical protein
MTPEEIERCHRDAEARAAAQGLPTFIEDPAFLHFAARTVLDSIRRRAQDPEERRQRIETEIKDRLAAQGRPGEPTEPSPT